MAKKQKPAPPFDRGWAWMIVLGVFIYVFFMVGIAKSFGLFIIEFKQRFEISTAYAATSMSVTAFVYAFGAPLAILLGETFTPQKVVMVGAVIGCIGMALSSFLFSMSFVIFTFGLAYGMGNSCLYGNGIVMIGKYFRVKRSLANGIALAGASIGQFALPPIIEFLLENYGLSGTLLIIGGLYLHCAISGALFRPIERYGPEVKTDALLSDIEVENTERENDKTGEAEFDEIFSPEHEEKMNKTERQASGENGMDSTKAVRLSEIPNDEEDTDEKTMLSSASHQDPGSSIDPPHKPAPNLESDPSPKHLSIFRRVFDFSVLKNYVTVFFTIVSFFCFFGYFNFILFLPALVVEKGIAKYEKALLISICGIGDLIVRPTIGFIADLNLIPRYIINATACILCAANMLVFIYANTFNWLAVHCFFYGVFGGGYVCLTPVVLIDFVGLEKMSKNLAVVLLIQGIGGACGQPFLGWVRDSWGSYSPVTFICSTCLGLGGLLLFCYPYVRRLDEKRTKDQRTETVC